MTFRLLTSCRDAGSAGHFDVILREISTRTDIAVSCHADGPAHDILERKGHPARRFGVPAMRTGNAAHAQALLSEAWRIIALEQPDAILVGVSHSEEAGLDEAFLAAAGAVPTYAIQDFWGDVNTNLGTPASLHFVLDDVAATLTSTRHGVAATVIGSPKHAHYAHIDITALRNDGRRRLGADATRPVIGYFGQSLSHLPGYRDTLCRLAQTVVQQHGDALFAYKPHPRESRCEADDTLALFAACGLQPTPMTDGGAELWLATCDLVVSCFSSCAYDSLFLNRHSAAPLNTALHLLFDESVADYFRGVSGMNVPPPVTTGLVAAVRDVRDLAPMLKSGLDAAMRTAVWQRVRHDLPDPSAAARVLLDCILGTRAANEHGTVTP